MKHKILSLMLAAVMALGLVVPALAYETPDFTDVPAGNWAYDSVMRMADRGIVKGTGNKMFSPNGIATAEQFLTLVGRVVFPEVKASGSDCSFVSNLRQGRKQRIKVRLYSFRALISRTV